MGKMYRVTGHVRFSGLTRLYYSVFAESEDAAIGAAVDYAADFVEFDDSDLVAIEMPMDQRMREECKPELFDTNMMVLDGMPWEIG